jgi:hypothetical protein
MVRAVGRSSVTLGSAAHDLAEQLVGLLASATVRRRVVVVDQVSEHRVPGLLRLDDRRLPRLLLMAAPCVRAVAARIGSEPHSPAGKGSSLRIRLVMAGLNPQPDRESDAMAGGLDLTRPARMERRLQSLEDAEAIRNLKPCYVALRDHNYLPEDATWVSSVAWPGGGLSERHVPGHGRCALIVLQHLMRLAGLPAESRKARGQQPLVVDSLCCCSISSGCFQPTGVIG